MINTQETLFLPSEEVLGRLNTSLSGLSSEEAERRQELYGTNEVAEQKRRTIVIDFLTHFRNPLVIILLIAAILSSVLGQLTHAVIILAIVLGSVILAFFQEHRAGKAADELRKRVATKASVFRDNRKLDIDVSELVPGDVLALSAGDIVPADARVLSSKDFFIDQSALTGESFPAEKIAEPPKGTNIPDTAGWTNYLFMGTSVANGTAIAVVTKTGNSTEYGAIVKKSLERKPETEFDRGLRRFGFLIMQVTFVIVALVFLANALFKHSVLDSMLFAVALAVGLTPELLPMILAINLARGATAMSKKGVIVKRLASLQNFGSMDTLCSDKTGTLTENRVTVIRHVDMEGRRSEKVLLYAFLNSLYQTGLKSPLDEAVLRYEKPDVQPYQKIDEVPFDFVRRRVSVVVTYDSKRFIITKGAPEEIIRVCSYYELNEQISDLASSTKSKIEQKYHDLSHEGFRVLGISYRATGEVKPTYSVPDETAMVFLGFIAFIDPLKETARESLELLREAGVRLKILTGDNEVVTRKICQDLGFQVSRARRTVKYDQVVEIRRIVLGSEIDQMRDDALARIVEKVDIFAKVTPAQKNRIMNALRSNGHVVGFIGDGINDTPSMKVADVSISVENAVDIAKEAADIILLHHDLKIIWEGVLEGRKTFGNTMKYIQMGISSNFGNMVSAAASSLFLPFLPMLPIQILFNNFLYDIAQISIPTDNVDQEYIARAKRLEISFIRSFMIFFGPVSSLFDFLTFFVMLYIFHASAPLFQTAWFVESLFTQTLVIFAIRTRQVPFLRSRPSKPLLINIAVILAIALAVPFTPLGNIFGFIGLPAKFIIILVIFIIVYLALVELMKVWFYRRHTSSSYAPQ
jgi:Mg2+-importing ATPase